MTAITGAVNASCMWVQVLDNRVIASELFPHTDVNFKWLPSLLVKYVYISPYALLANAESGLARSRLQIAECLVLLCIHFHAAAAS